MSSPSRHPTPTSSLRRPASSSQPRRHRQHEPQLGTSRVKRGMAEMLKGGVIMDVVNAEQAKIAEDAGAVAVMALERVPADIRQRRWRRAHVRPRHD